MTYNQRRKIAIATSTRADWGLLSPLAKRLSSVPEVECVVIATNMHLDPRRGNTINEIVADGFHPEICAIELPADDSPLETAKGMARCLDGFATTLDKLQPDEIIILGDRYEMLAVASAATILRIPIIHIAGGEISEGAIDDSIRHAITKLSALHLTSTEPYRQRVISMGEPPERVFNTGAIGVSNLQWIKPMSKTELEESIGFTIDRNTIIVTIHPATTSESDTAPEALFDALSELTDIRAIITYPNNDAHGNRIIELIENFVLKNSHRAKAIPSLGHQRYLSSLRYAGAVVGNSSSGIVEVPSAKIPTVNIGPRQNGRIAADSVINCGETKSEICEAIRLALSDKGQRTAQQTVNPYFQPDTLEKMTDAIMSFTPGELKQKHFYDK